MYKSMAGAKCLKLCSDKPHILASSPYVPGCPDCTEFACRGGARTAGTQLYAFSQAHAPQPWGMVEEGG